MAGSSFEDALYRLLENEEPEAGARELKPRLDREPEFKARFDRARDAVISLQGLSCGSTRPRTFGPRDLDKLTRDIVKGYRAKLSEILFQLGTAYFVESGRPGFGVHTEVAPPSASDSRERLQKARTGLRSIAGPGQGLADEARQALQEVGENGIGARTPAKEARSCFKASRTLSPRFSAAWAREASSLIHDGNVADALPLIGQAEDLAQGWADQELVLTSRNIALAHQRDYASVIPLLDRFLKERPDWWKGRINRAVALYMLKDFEASFREWGRILLLAQEDAGIRSMCQASIRGGFGSSEASYSASFDRFLEMIEVSLGKGFAAMAAQVSHE